MRRKKGKFKENLQDAAIWSQVLPLPKAAEFAVSVQQPLISVSVSLYLCSNL